jgi:hypothetical protein
MALQIILDELKKCGSTDNEGEKWSTRAWRSHSPEGEEREEGEILRQFRSKYKWDYANFSRRVNLIYPYYSRS